MFLKPYKRDALVLGDERYSYTDLIQYSNGYSSLIKGKEGDRIAIFSESRPQWVFALYGIWGMDGIAVPMDYMSSVDELYYMLEDCKPTEIFYSEGTKEVCLEAVNKLSFSIRSINLDELNDIDVSQESLDYSIPSLDTTAEILYTSGTTGNPKGVMLSFDNILLNVEQVGEEDIYNEGDRFIQILPIHHSFALHGNLVAPLYWGATLFMINKLDPQTIIDTLQKNKITHMLVVPRLLQLFHKKIFQTIDSSFAAKSVFKMASNVKSRKKRRKIFKKVHQVFGGHLKYIVSGGARLEDDIWKDFDRLGFEILNGYGMTEMAPMISNTSPNGTKFGTVGTLIKSVEAKIVDGEIVVRGRNLMKGYFNLPAETAEVLRDNWLYTGDLGFLDDEGYLCITGRRKELIILSNGKNISPEEIENKILEKAPFIQDIGVYEDGDRLHAVLTPNFALLKQQQTTDVDRIVRDFILNKYNPSVSPYKKIMHFRIVTSELPRTRLGKLKRFELQEFGVVATEKLVVGQQKESVVFKILSDYIQGEKGCTVSPSDDIEVDISMDSLDRVEFQVFIQSTFELTIDEALFSQYRTLQALSDYIEENSSSRNVKTVHWAEVLKEKIEFKLPTSGPLHLIIRFITRVSFSMFFKYKVKGLEHLPEGPFILAPNHQSSIDGLVASTMLPRGVLKKTYTFAKEKHFKHQWRRFMAKRNNIIIVDMNKELKVSIQKVAHVLKQKGNLIIFPEGTRSRDGELLPFKKTFAILSRELQIPIIPVTIQGTADAFPIGRLMPKLRSRISIDILKPIYPEKMSYTEVSDKVKNSINQKLDSLKLALVNRKK